MTQQKNFKNYFFSISIRSENKIKNLFWLALAGGVRALWVSEDPPSARAYLVGIL